jgi:hypothetical protein
MPESAFFDDTLPAAGDKAAWKTLWIATSALIVLVVSGYLVALNFGVAFPGNVPDGVLAAARAANAVLPDANIVSAHWTVRGYEVLSLSPSGAVWEPSVTVHLSRLGDVVKVVSIYGDPRPTQRAAFVAGACGVLAAVTALYRNRRGISLWVKPRHDWT